MFSQQLKSVILAKKSYIITFLISAIYICYLQYILFLHSLYTREDLLEYLLLPCNYTIPALCFLHEIKYQCFVMTKKFVSFYLLKLFINTSRRRNKEGFQQDSFTRNVCICISLRSHKMPWNPFLTSNANVNADVTKGGQSLVLY